jgi:hypothetical protein
MTNFSDEDLFPLEKEKESINQKEEKKVAIKN